MWCFAQWACCIPCTSRNILELEFTKISNVWRMAIILYSPNKQWSFPWRISSVNMTKSTVSCGFGHTYCGNLQRKTSFFVQWFPEKLKDAFSGLRQFLTIERPLKMMKILLFHLKGSFRSKDIFVLTFDDEQNNLIRAIRLISNFVTSRPVC